MLRFRFPMRRYVAFAVLAGAATIAAATAASVHPSSTSRTTGSGGAQAVLQNSASGSAFQGEVGGSTPNTTIRIPFGVLGEYDPPASSALFGIGVVGISTTGYGVGGESLGNEPSVLGYAGGSGPGFEGSTPSTSSAPPFYGEARGSGDGGDFYADQTGNGVYGSSASAAAIVGSNKLTSAPTFAQAFNGMGSGVFGQTQNGIGVVGYNDGSATPPPGGDEFYNAGVSGQSSFGNGVVGSTETSNGGIGIVGEYTGEGLEADGYSGTASHPALTAYDDAGGSDLIGAFACSGMAAGFCDKNAESFIVQANSGDRSSLTGAYSGAADVQVSGDLYVFGKVYDACAAFPAIAGGSNATSCDDVSPGAAAVARSAGGPNVKVYSAAQSVHTI